MTSQHISDFDKTVQSFSVLAVMDKQELRTRLRLVKTPLHHPQLKQRLPILCKVAVVHKAIADLRRDTRFLMVFFIVATRRWANL